jgi:adenylate cyclase
MNPAPAAAYLAQEDGAPRYPLDDGQSWAVGRGDGCPILLDSRSVSRLHALIQRRDGGDYSVVDLGSMNGSFVNGTRVGFPVVLRDGDALAFGELRFVFHCPARGFDAAPLETGTRNEPTAAMQTQTLTTIVVVDIRDFTPLARSLSEALLSQTLGAWFLRVGQAAQRLGSWAQRYAGDAMMAVWVHDNATRVASDLARALRAVCDIEAATREVSRALPLPAPLRIGAGVNTGPAMVGGSDYTALGEAVNLAFRLQEATKTLGLDVALGPGSFQALSKPHPGFTLRHVLLKGYENSSAAWGISFADLRKALGMPPL